MEAHQLPSECYPPTDSDDESFEVLATNDDSVLNVEDVKPQLLKSDPIDVSLEQANMMQTSSASIPSISRSQSIIDNGSVDSFDTTTTNGITMKDFKVLVEERRVLTNTLQQTNMILENHNSILSKWGKDNAKVQEVYVTQMQEQYDKLREQMDKLSTSHAGSENSNSQAKLVEDVGTSMESLKLKETNDLKNLQTAYDQQTQDLHTLQTEFNKTKDDLNTSQNKIDFLEQELQNYKIRDDETNAVLQQVRNDLQKAVQDAKNAKEELQLMKEMNSQQVLEISDLQKQIVTNTTMQKIPESIQQSWEPVTSQQDFDKVVAELDQYKELNEQQMLRINDLKCQVATLQDKLTKTSDELVNTKEDLTLTKNAKEVVDNEFAKIKETAAQSQEMLTKRITMVDDLMKENKLLTDGIENYKKDIKQLKSELDEKAILQDKINEYKTQINANDKELQKLELENVELQQKRQKLLEDVTVLKCKVVKLEGSDTAEVQQLKIQLSEAQSAVVTIKEEKKMIEKEAEQNRLLIDDLNKQLKEANCNCDRIVALEQQSQIYRGEFESERESKIRMIDELNKVSEDLSNVHQRNRELVEEIEKLRNEQASATASAESFVTVPRPKKTPSPPLSHFPCPLCGEMFRSARAIEDHVESCIDNAPF